MFVISIILLFIAACFVIFGIYVICDDDYDTGSVFIAMSVICAFIGGLMMHHILSKTDVEIAKEAYADIVSDLTTKRKQCQDTRNYTEEYLSRCPIEIRALEMDSIVAYIKFEESMQRRLQNLNDSLKNINKD